MTPHLRGRRLARTLLPIAVYAALGVLANLPAWLHGAGHTLQCGGCGDNGQEVWFLAWSSHALTHWQSPLRTNWINYPWGVDLADNTSMPLAGIVGAPITLLFGPIATYNVLISCAFAGSATAAMFAFRRWVSAPAAFFGGLLYGFSPYMIGQGTGHLFLLLAFVPPLMLLAFDEIFVRQRLRWWLAGLLLGLLGVVQLGLSLELFADAALLSALGLAVLAVSRRQLIAAKLPYAAKSLGIAAILVAPAALWFAFVSRTGAEHTSHSVHNVTTLSGLSTDIASLFSPTMNQRFSLGTASFGNRLVELTPLHGPHLADVTESGAYIGIPLLLLLVVGVWRLRRDALVRFGVLMALITLVISFGNRLQIFGCRTAVPLPFALLTHLPFTDSEIASRYSLFMWLFVALALARILDDAIATHRLPATRRQTATHRRAGPLSGRLLLVALAVAGIVSLVPAWPYPIQQAAIVEWFGSPAVHNVPAGSTLLTYPMARNSHNLPMLWQAVNGFRYRIPAGEAAVPAPHVGALEVAFDTCWANPGEEAPAQGFVTAARRDLDRWQVRTIVVPLMATINPMCAVRFLQTLVREPPRLQYGAEVWHLHGLIDLRDPVVPAGG